MGVVSRIGLTKDGLTCVGKGPRGGNGGVLPGRVEVRELEKETTKTEGIQDDPTLNDAMIGMHQQVLVRESGRGESLAPQRSVGERAGHTGRAVDEGGGRESV